MVFDVITYNGEQEMLEIRLNILAPYVDKFIICEAKTTFTGKPKPLYFSAQEKFFKKWWKKIDYFIIEEDYTPQEIALAESSPNTKGAAHWKHEFLQKESIKKALVNLQDNDTVFIGDADEIWTPNAKYFVDRPYKIELLVYTYWLNNRSTERFWGTLVANYQDIKDVCLNHLRSNALKELSGSGGWHFTSMGGYKALDKKLQDQYTDESYYTPWVKEHLEENVAQSKDFLGRDFTYTIDESEWPQYLKDHKRKYAHLCK